MKITVKYENGRAAEYKVKPRHLIRYEDEYGVMEEKARDVFQLAHIVSQDPRPFYEFLDDVDEIIPPTGDESAADAGMDGGEDSGPVPTEPPSQP